MTNSVIVKPAHVPTLIRYQPQINGSLLIIQTFLHADRQGQVADVVHLHKPTAMDGALCTSRDKTYWPEECQALEGDEVIHMLPKKLDPSAEVRACSTPPAPHILYSPSMH